MWIDGSEKSEQLRETASQLEVSESKWKSSIGSFISQWLDDSDSVAVKTSGSTGEPKKIFLSKKLMRKSAENTASFFNLNKEGTTALLCLSAENVGGKMMIVRALTHGWKLFCEEPTSTPNKKNERFDFAAMVPLQVEKLLDENPERLNCIGKVIVGGAPISQRLEKRMQGSKSELFATYGMTETASHVALRALNGSDRSVFFKLLPGIRANQDERGCLFLEAPFFKSKIVTNDIVEFEDFDAFRWLGRYDNVINSGGVKIVPEQVEQKLEELIDRRFYVSSKPHDQLGERVVLHIESEPLATSIEKLLKSEMRELLHKYEVPKEIEYHTKFEETRTGKVKRKRS